MLPATQLLSPISKSSSVDPRSNVSLVTAEKSLGLADDHLDRAAESEETVDLGAGPYERILDDLARGTLLRRPLRLKLLDALLKLNPVVSRGSETRGAACDDTTTVEGCAAMGAGAGRAALLALVRDAAGSSRALSRVPRRRDSSRFWPCSSLTRRRSSATSSPWAAAQDGASNAINASAAAADCGRMARGRRREPSPAFFSEPLPHRCFRLALPPAFRP